MICTCGRCPDFAVDALDGWTLTELSPRDTQAIDVGIVTRFRALLARIWEELNHE